MNYENIIAMNIVDQSLVQYICIYIYMYEYDDRRHIMNIIYILYIQRLVETRVVYIIISIISILNLYYLISVCLCEALLLEYI